MFITMLIGKNGIDIFDHNPEGSKQDMNEAILAFDPFQEAEGNKDKENGTKELLKQFKFIEV